MNMLIQNHPFYSKLLDGTKFDQMGRHDKTQIVIKNAIASFIRNHAPEGRDLLEIGGHIGRQTIIYRDQMSHPNSTTLYDWKNFVDPEVSKELTFKQVDLETESFPDDNESFDVIVCNQVFEHLKNIFTPLSECWRKLRPGGLLILSVPNLSALHNCGLLWFGKQPTTLNIGGSHVRGYGIHSMTRFLTGSGHFDLVDLEGIGLHPFTSNRMPGIFKTWCHTPIWAIRKSQSSAPLWDEKRAAEYTTTNFLPDQGE
jgi:hypothetical protein